MSLPHVENHLIIISNPHCNCWEIVYCVYSIHFIVPVLCKIHVTNVLQEPLTELQ